MRNCGVSILFVLGALLGSFWFQTEEAHAAPNYEINYQGKLTDGSNIAVPDGTYNMRFWLLTSPSIATTSAIWTESLTGTNRVQVTNGLFSVMLGSTSALTSVDFNQTLYLGVEIGSTTTSPNWDGEMSPRKILGAVPAAFEADHASSSSLFDGLATTSFLRSDQDDTVSGAITFTGTTTHATSTFSLASTSNLRIGADTISDLTGAGLIISGSALTASITPTVLNSSNSGSNGECLTYQDSNFKWGSCGGSSAFTTSGSVSYLTDTTHHLAIGTTTALGVLTVATSSATTTASFAQYGAGDILNLFSSGNEVFTVDNSGSVGIGTSSPASKLDVWGSLRVGTSSAPVLYVDTSTNRVGLGTANPTYPFQIGSDPSTGVAVDTNANISAGAFIFNSDTNTGLDNPAADTLGLYTGGTARIIVNSNGNVGIGTSSPTLALLSLDDRGLSGSTIAGLRQNFDFVNTVQSAVYYGDNAYINNFPTATSTLVGSIIRIQDSSHLGNTVRGLEVQANRGTTTRGENTALSGFARTFGVRGTTDGSAGDTYIPAGVFAETTGTTQGNALRAYSGSITTADLVYLFQDTSDFTGTGLRMDFGNAGGSFAATSSTALFLELNNQGTTVFKVAANGSTTIGDGTTNASLIIPRGGICVDDNGGNCISTTTGQIKSVSQVLYNSDLAEVYFSSDSLEPGEIVSTESGISVGRASGDTVEKIIGVVSTKPGVTLGIDNASPKEGEKGYPVALSGRVPILLSTENGPIKTGDKITLSSIPGVGMKASSSGVILGIALEDYDGEHAYSEGYINQFSDSVSAPKSTSTTEESDPRANDGCSYGGGGTADSPGCAPHASSTAKGADQNAKSTTTSRFTEKFQRMLALSKVSAKNETTSHGERVAVGRALMFVNLTWDSVLPGNKMITELMSTTSTSTLVEGDGGTLWGRIKALAQHFVAGVLTVFQLNASKVQVDNELCVSDVCVTSDDLRVLLDRVNESTTYVKDGNQPIVVVEQNDTGSSSKNTNTDKSAETSSPLNEEDTAQGGVGGSGGGNATSSEAGVDVGTSTVESTSENSATSSNTVNSPATESSGAANTGSVATTTQSQSPSGDTSGQTDTTSTDTTTDASSSADSGSMANDSTADGATDPGTMTQTDASTDSTPTDTTTNTVSTDPVSEPVPIVEDHAPAPNPAPAPDTSTTDSSTDTQTP